MNITAQKSCVLCIASAEFVSGLYFLLKLLSLVSRLVPVNSHWVVCYVDKVTTVTPCFFCRLAGVAVDSDSSMCSAPRLLGMRRMKEGGMELSFSCPISAIYMIFSSSTSLDSQFSKTSILRHETCGKHSVINPFENWYTLIPSLCPFLFWATFEVHFDSGRNIQVYYFPTSRECLPNRSHSHHSSLYITTPCGQMSPMIPRPLGSL